jgi:L-malate glycosyltransferase
MHGDDNLKNNLAGQDYWDEGYASYKLVENTDDDSITAWVKSHVPPNERGSCLEVGCFPGRYLTLFGRLGYELNGVDLTPRVKQEFPEWLRSRGYRTGEFVQQDFFSFPDDKKFDVVCSFGFIEHFKNWEQVFKRHVELVRPGGYLVIETPNFKGFVQRFIHYYLDNNNYKRHYIPAMNPRKWARICREHGLKVITSGYIGKFQFWVDQQPSTGFRRIVFQWLIDHYPRLSRLPANRKLYAPYCGIIAQLPLK